MMAFFQRPKLEKKPSKEIVSKKTEVTEEDIREVLRITDELLGDLPEEEIEEFAKSEKFERYKKVLSRFLPEDAQKEVEKILASAKKANPAEEKPREEKPAEEKPKEEKLDITKIKKAIEKKLTQWT